MKHLAFLVAGLAVLSMRQEACNPCSDADGDGYTTCEGDCNDADGAIHPGAEEQCDGLDNDCDGATGIGEVDNDLDGVSLCEGDCDDQNPAVYPGAGEQCDGLDDDCDGTVPEDELDADGDGVAPCAGDCNDRDATIYPGAKELCDGIDNDCDGSISPEELDRDGDGFSSCAGDCNDDSTAAFPGAPEQCDGQDNDCDGQLSEDEADRDGDGVAICAGDCDDTQAQVYPDALEVCDRLDNDCDGSTDEDGVCHRCDVIEGFEAGTWPEYPWDGGGIVGEEFAHDGVYGYTGEEFWSYRTDIQVGKPGDLLSMWTRTSADGEGRMYLGFDADAAGARSFVIAPNTGDIRFQDNPAYDFVSLGSIPQTFSTSTWYRMEVEFLGEGVVEGRLFSEDGTTLLNSIAENFGDELGMGGIAIRSFFGVAGDTLSGCASFAQGLTGASASGERTATTSSSLRRSGQGDDFANRDE